MNKTYQQALKQAEEMLKYTEEVYDMPMKKKKPLVKRKLKRAIQKKKTNKKKY